jgi:hypothetical protein
MFYSKLTNGFYDTEIHGEKIPDDAFEITPEEYDLLLKGQSTGGQIKADSSGKPFIDPYVASEPDVDQLLVQLATERKEQERQGVTINGIRYAGDPGNRQALQESIAFMDNAGLTEFPKWKCSDDEFHVNHPLADVFDAYRAVGMRRVALIAAEGEYAAQITAGTLTDLSEVVWP